METTTTTKHDELIEKYGTLSNDFMEGDGNTIAILGRFKRQARKEGWEREDIQAMQDHILKHDYDTILQIFVQLTP